MIIIFLFLFFIKIYFLLFRISSNKIISPHNQICPSTPGGVGAEVVVANGEMTKKKKRKED